MTDRELLEKAIYWFKVIAEDMERITAGNLPHNAATTRGRAIRAYEFLEKHKEEHVSEKKCMFTKDSYNGEDRKVLCEDCKENCEYSKKEEPVSEEFEEALAREWQGYNDRGAATVDALEDNTQELAFAKGFYRGAKWQLNKIRKENE